MNTNEQNVTEVGTLWGFLKNPRYFTIFIVAFILLISAYTFFDLREGMREQSLTTTKLATPQRFIELFGSLYIYAAMVLNVLQSLLTAFLIAFSIANYKKQKSMGAACSTTSTVLLGFATFGCPGCYLPLAGSLGVSFFSASLPLMGLEFKILSIIIILVTLFWIIRRSSRLHLNLE